MPSTSTLVDSIYTRRVSAGECYPPDLVKSHKVYCARGEMENRIKEQQLGLFADRTSAHDWWTNQFRLLLSSLAYVLMESIRRLALHGTELAHAQVGTLRLKLLKVGAIVLRNTRRIRFLFHPLTARKSEKRMKYPG